MSFWYFWHRVRWELMLEKGPLSLARRQRRGGPGRRQRRRAREFGAVREGPDGELIYYDPLDENVDIPLNDSSEEELQDAFRR